MYLIFLLSNFNANVRINLDLISNVSQTRVRCPNRVSLEWDQVNFYLGPKAADL